MQPNGPVIDVRIDDNTTAAELDALLRKLAMVRVEMDPPIPQTVEDLERSDAKVLVEDKPGLVIAALRDGGFRLWLRHRGFGWLAYQIDARSAIGMADYVNSRTNAEAVNLVTHDEPNRH